MKKDIFKMLLYIFLLIPFFQIEYLTITYPVFSSIYKILLLFSEISIILLYLKGNKLSKITLYVTIFELVLIFASILNSSEVSTQINVAIKLISLTCLIDYGVKNDTKNFINAFLLLLEILIYSNFISILIYPDGMYDTHLQSYNWILGYDNSHIIYFITAFYISYINKMLNKNQNFRFILLTIISMLSVFIRFSATSIVGYSLILLFMIFNKTLKNTKIFNIYNYLITNLILFFAIVIFRVQNLFSYLIVNILHKDLTFTNRTGIWDRTIAYINKSILFGYGLEPSTIRSTKNNFIYGINAHNFILEIMYQGGILALISFVAILISACKKLYKYKNNMVSKVVSFVIFVLFLMMITEYYNIQFIFIVLVFAFNIEYIIKKIGDSNE